MSLSARFALRYNIFRFMESGPGDSWPGDSWPMHNEHWTFIWKTFHPFHLRPPYLWVWWTPNLQTINAINYQPEGRDIKMTKYIWVKKDTKLSWISQMDSFTSSFPCQSQIPIGLCFSELNKCPWEVCSIIKNHLKIPSILFSLQSPLRHQNLIHQRPKDT